MTKRFSSKVMETPLTIMVSRGMFRKLRERKKESGESFSGYIRNLIMNDMKIDYNGDQVK